METRAGEPSTALGDAIDKRLRQLGLSRRELSRRVCISRQTLHELEHNPNKGFAESTFRELDTGLKWEPGTAKAYHQGKPLAREMSQSTINDRIETYLVRIMERLEAMDIDQLEREVLLLEEESNEHLTARDLATNELVARHIRALRNSWVHRKRGKCGE